MSDGVDLAIVLGEITTLDLDAIVNVANSGLCGGRGVDGAIHRAAGPQLPPAARAQGPCPAGHAGITPGFRRRRATSINAVGPVWVDGHRGEDELPQRCVVAIVDRMVGEHGADGKRSGMGQLGLS